ncbi:hypothetical protein Syun_023298 [Stephania yunnanensis]|uniref:Uncharacterized protein n=1 Tax=Stephania yunnanensis TaxID=152371 RepID=A0AAP0FBT5_9MAGN
MQEQIEEMTLSSPYKEICCLISEPFLTLKACRQGDGDEDGGGLMMIVVVVVLRDFATTIERQQQQQWLYKMKSFVNGDGASGSRLSFLQLLRSRLVFMAARSKRRRGRRETRLGGSTRCSTMREFEHQHLAYRQYDVDHIIAWRVMESDPIISSGVVCNVGTSKSPRPIPGLSTLANDLA